MNAAPGANPAAGLTAGRAAEVAAEIEVAVRSVPGVSDLYRPGSLVSNVMDRGARRLGLRDDAGPVVLVRQSGPELRVGVALGVHPSPSAAVTTSTVHNAVRHLLTQQGLGDAHIVVTVVHVDDSPVDRRQASVTTSGPSSSTRDSAPRRTPHGSPGTEPGSGG